MFDRSKKTYPTILVLDMTKDREDWLDLTMFTSEIVVYIIISYEFSFSMLIKLNYR